MCLVCAHGAHGVDAGRRPEIERLEREIAKLCLTNKEMEKIYHQWKAQVAQAEVDHRVRLRQRESSRQAEEREEELSRREGELARKQLMLGALIQQYNQARQKMRGLPELPGHFLALTE